MSSVEIPSAPIQDIPVNHGRPSFFGLVYGELFKIRRQVGTWVGLIVLIALTFVPYLIALSLSGVTDNLNQAPGSFLGEWLGENLLLLRVVSGFILIILTARAIGQEYNLGTIRVILARGVGRAQLLTAKLTAVALWAVLLLVINLILNFLLTLILIQIKAGSLNAFGDISSSVWHDLGLEVGTIALSMGATILMAAAISVLGRSLAFGMSISMIWFPIDNILVGILLLVTRLTNNDFWSNITGYFLGPNLNEMGHAITGQDWSIGSAPLTSVDGTHTVMVTIVYAAIFALVAFWLTWKRDVKE